MPFILGKQTDHMRWIVGIWKFLLGLLSFIRTEQDERQQDFDEYRIRIFDPVCDVLVHEHKSGAMLLPDFVYQYSIALRAMVDVFDGVVVMTDGKQQLTIKKDSSVLFVIFSDWVARGKETPPGIMILTSDMAGPNFKELKTRISVSNSVDGRLTLAFIDLATTQDLLGLEFKPI